MDSGDTPTADSSPAKPLIPSKMSDLDEQESRHFLARMVDAFWRLHGTRPSNSMLAPACLPGKLHDENEMELVAQFVRN